MVPYGQRSVPIGSPRCIVSELVVVAGKLVASISNLQTFSTKINTDGLTSKRTLQFCCKVMDCNDGSNFVLSQPVVVKVETGEGDGMARTWVGSCLSVFLQCGSL